MSQLLKLGEDGWMEHLEYTIQTKNGKYGFLFQSHILFFHQIENTCIIFVSESEVV